MTGRRTTLAMMVVMLAFGLASLRWGEKLPVGGGFGWDGVNYGSWAKDFNKSIFVDKVSDYYVQRIAPSAVVHFGTKQLLRPFYSHHRIHEILSENKSIILAFGIYNLVLLVLAVWLWNLIADQLVLSDRGKWFGFCALFINYAIAKSNFYQPVLTDTTAFFLGLLMFYFFLKRNSIGLLVVMIIGGFTWPTFPFMAALLLVFPRAVEPAAEQTVSSATARKLSVGISSILCLAVLWFFIYLFRQNAPSDWSKTIIVRVDFGLAYLSVAAVLIYLFFGFRTALRNGRLFHFRYLLNSLDWKGTIGAVVVLIGIQIAVHRLASPIPSSWNFGQFFIYLFISSLTEPFIFIVSHAVYYGPIILLLLIFWGPFCQRASQFGIGFMLFVLLNLALSICPQSRYQIPAVSAFAIVMVSIIDRLTLPRWHLAVWFVLSICYSKIWYTFNTAPMNPSDMASLLSFPIQHFFMNSGPWMSHPMYLVQGTIVLLTLALLAWGVRSLRLRDQAVHAMSH